MEKVLQKLFIDNNLSLDVENKIKEFLNYDKCCECHEKIKIKNICYFCFGILCDDCNRDSKNCKKCNTILCSDCITYDDNYNINCYDCGLFCKKCDSDCDCPTCYFCGEVGKDGFYCESHRHKETPFVCFDCEQENGMYKPTSCHKCGLVSCIRCNEKNNMQLCLGCGSWYCLECFDKCCDICQYCDLFFEVFDDQINHCECKCEICKEMLIDCECSD